MRVLLFATSLLLVFAAGPAGASSDPATYVGRVVRIALAQAPSSFAHSRGKEVGRDSSEIRYAVVGALHAGCPSCKLMDEFADEDAHERWVTSFDYALPKGWSDSRVAEFIATAIGPIVREYALQTGTDDDGLTYFDWKRAGTFIYATSWSDKHASTLRVRIGHYSPKDVHVAQYSTPLTDSQKTQLDADIKNFLAVGLANAQQNFVTLKGKGWSGDVFDATLQFSMLHGCAIDGWKKTSATAGKWILTCDTESFVDDKSTLESAISHTIWMALPNAFRQASESDRGTNDYRWDDASNMLSVMLNAESYGKRTHYTISIFHFLDQ